MANARYVLAAAAAPTGIYAVGGYNGAAMNANEFFRSPEVDGQGSVTGYGVVVSQPVGIGAASGHGVAVGNGDSVFSGRTMQPGPIRLNP
jgi:hypothetical protein